MMAIKEKMFNGFVTVKEITLLIAFPTMFSNRIIEASRMTTDQTTNRD